MKTQLCRLSYLALTVSAIGCGAANDGTMSESGVTGGNAGALAGSGAAGQPATAGLGPSGGTAGAGPIGQGGNSTPNGGSASGGSAGDGNAGAPSAGSGGAGAAAGAGGGIGGGGQSNGAGGGFSYQPIKGAKYDELPLFDGNPPNFKSGAPAETVNAQGSISNVSVPTLRRYPMDGSKATGFAYIVFPGGAYTGLDMETHATRLAERVGPLGIAVFGLKYRVGGGSDDAPRDALLDAKRAVRLVRHNAQQWAVASQHVGVIGYSAGSHLALNLAGNFDAGDAKANDPVEQLSSRPAFVGSMSTWAFYKPDSPFTFPNDVPPTYFCHAEDDTTAPIALARTVEAQIRAKGAATKLDIYATGGHSTCHPGDTTMPGHDWPNKFWPWVQTVVAP